MLNRSAGEFGGCLGILATVVMLSASTAAAQYPVRPLRLVVPYPPGGGTDLIARTLAERLGERLGQQIVVDNRGGASTIIGAEIAMRMPADGYNLFVATVTTLATNPVMHRKLSYDPVRDFEPVSLLATQPYVLTVHPSVPVASVPQFIAYAKANPGRLTVGSPGQGSGGHLAGEMFKHLTGVDFRHVPYKGIGPAVTDLLGGHISSAFAGVTTVRAHAAAGKLRALGVTTAHRSASAPDIPTIAESGVAGYETNTWNSLVVPRGTPRAIIERLNTETVASMGRADVREKLREQGADAALSTPEELAKHIQAEIARFKRLATAVGIRPQ
jgi:tripartite-type tricarboxylate transporter receptor subunit TctC